MQNRRKYQAERRPPSCPADDIEIDITDASARELETLLLDGNLEVAILCRPNRPLDERIHAMPLFREQMMAVIRPITRWRSMRRSESKTCTA